MWARNIGASVAEDWTEQIKSSSGFMMNMLKLQRNTMKQENIQPPKSHEIVWFENPHNSMIDCSTFISHALDFEADRKVWLHGIGLYGASNNPNTVNNGKIKVDQTRRGQTV